MADNDDILKAIESLKKDMAIKSDVDALHHGVVDVMQGQERLEKGQQEQGKKLDKLQDGQVHIMTALETLDEKIEATKEEVDEIKKQQRPRHAD